MSGAIRDLTPHREVHRKREREPRGHSLELFTCDRYG